MTIFYTTQIHRDSLILEGDDFRHCVKSLRKKEGEKIYVADGFGQCYLSIIQTIKKDCLVATIKEQQSFDQKNGLCIAIAPTKNASRIETFVEKATEIGVREIRFVDFHYGEKPRIKLERIQKIALSAMKQSKQWWLPEIFPLQKFENFMADLPSMPAFFGHMDKNTPLWSTQIKDQFPALIIIGPEGHFHSKEITTMINKGIAPCSLGSTILRVETAGIVAASLFSHHNKI